MSDVLDQIEQAEEQRQAEQSAAQEAANTPEPVMDPALAWAQIPKAVGGILAIAMPELEGVYTDAACMKWGQGMSLVAEKYGWDASETMARYAPEMALVMATLPLAIPTVSAFKARRAAAEAAAKSTPVTLEAAPEQQTGATDGSAT